MSRIGNIDKKIASRKIMIFLLSIVLSMFLFTSAYSYDPMAGIDKFKVDPNIKPPLKLEDVMAASPDELNEIAKKHVIGKHSMTQCKAVMAKDSSWNGIPAKYIDKCGFTVRVVSYARASIVEVTKVWLGSLAGDTFIAAYLSLLCLLALTLHGVKMTLGGLENPAGDSFYLILKIGAVVYFTLHLQDFAHFPFAVLDMLCSLPSDILNVILKTTGSGVMSEDVWGANGISCVDIPEGNGYLSLWMNMDCLMARVFGVAFDGQTVAGGIAILLIALLYSGPMCISVFFMFVAILWFFVGTYLKAVFIYIRAMINLMILSIIGVIIIPFILLPKSATGTMQGTFNSWIKQIMDSVLIPFLMYVYLSFFIILCVLCYEDIYMYLSTMTSDIGTCEAFGLDISTFRKLVKTAIISVANLAIGAFNPNGVEGFICLSADTSNVKNVAISAAVFLLASYLMYAYYRFFIALAAALGGQFDATLTSNVGMGKHFKTAVAGAKAAGGNYAALARQAIKKKK